MRRDQHTVREVHLKKMVTDTLKIAAFVGEISKYYRGKKTTFNDILS